jgi:hypothetical protein
MMDLYDDFSQSFNLSTLEPSRKVELWVQTKNRPISAMSLVSAFTVRAKLILQPRDRQVNNWMGDLSAPGWRTGRRWL